MKQCKKALSLLLSIAMLLTMCVFAGIPANAATSTTVIDNSYSGRTLSAGYYLVNSNVSCSGSGANTNGLIIAAGAKVVIEIRKGCTLTVNGGNGSGTAPGGAGILLPSNSTLIIVGEGTLNVKGGNSGWSASGSNGGSGQLSIVGNWFQGGTGGAGGYGAGGAGAGIGGNGGSGGYGGSERSGPYNSCNFNNDHNGNGGNGGGNGSGGGTMGTLLRLGSVAVNATGGSGASQAGGGSAGGGANDAGSGWTNNYAAGGGGGGGGGGATDTAPGIGGGTGGAGGGGSGGSGGTYTHKNTHYYVGGNGGGGGANYGGGGASAYTDGYCNGRQGGGGSGGSRGGNGGNGYNYDTSNAPSTGVNVDIYLNGNNGTNGAVNYVLWSNTVNSYTASTRVGYTLDGYYTQASGGTKVLNANGTIAGDAENFTKSSKWNTVSNTTLYAHWTPNVYKITLDGQGAETNTTSYIYEKYDTGIYANQECTIELLSAPLPTKTGYTFDGFYTAPEGQGKQMIKPNGAVNTENFLLNSYSAEAAFYAKWLKNYKVTIPTSVCYVVNQTTAFNVDGVPDGSEFKFTVAPTTPYSQRTPVVKIDGAVQTAVDGIYSVIVDRDISINIGELDLNEYTITYPETQEHYSITEFASTAVHGSSKTFKLTVDEAYTQCNPVVKSNGTTLYPVDGVYTIENIVDDIVITVGGVDTINKYSVTFLDYDDSPIEVKEVNYGEDVIVDNEPTRTDEIIGNQTVSYSFAGWFDENDVQVFDFSNIKNDITVKAKYNQGKFYFVTFYNENGSVILNRISVEEGKVVTYQGTSPIKLSNAQYSYTPIGWSSNPNDTKAEYALNASIPVDSPKEYYAVFSSTVRKYIVTFYDEDENCYDTQEVEYGSLVQFNGANEPTKLPDEQYTYTFIGWDKSLDSTYIQGATKFIAKFRQDLRVYSVKYYADNEENQLLYSVDAEYGKGAVYQGETPYKAPTTEKTYSFFGWDISTDDVKGDLKVHAIFRDADRFYTVSYYNGNTLLQTKQVQYGKSIAYDGEEPKKESSQLYCYEFLTWSRDTSVITGDTRVDAVFSELPHVPTQVITPATCIEEGLIENYCSHCGRLLSSSKIDSTNHSFGPWIEITSPTHTTEGIKMRSCTKCFKYETEKIGTLPTHSYSSSVTTPASCTQDGVLTYTCECGDSKDEVIPAKGHQLLDPVVVRPAGCTTDGESEGVCTGCGKSYIVYIPATGHIITEYTDNGDGTRSGICEQCGNVITVDADDVEVDENGKPIDSSDTDDNEAEKPTEFMNWWSNFWVWIKDFVVNFKSLLSFFK